MHKRNTLLFILFMSLSPNQSWGQDPDSLGRQLISDQLLLLSLVEPNEAFHDYYQLLEDNDQIYQGILKDSIEFELANYWQSKHIPLKDPNFRLKSNTYQRAIGLEPKLDDFLYFTNNIKHFIWLDDTYLWSALSLNNLIEQGDKHEQLNEIGLRLWLLGDLDDSAIIGDVYTSHFVDAVKVFQKRHGLETDGVIGPATLRWLNMRPFDRAKVLAENYVKKHAFLATKSAQFIVINIPGFHLLLMDNGEISLDSRVIVGKPSRQTPQLSSEITNVVINPSWRVPKRIMHRDLLPKIRRDGRYINNGNYEVYDRQGNKLFRTPEQWSDIAKGAFPYRLVQKPGVKNTLGRYKFYFPNDFSIYLHDTANPRLFNKANRALSSGCIRVEKVKLLAEWMADHLVNDKKTWQRMQTKREQSRWFSLKASLPIHLVYWTTWIDDQGQVQYRRDIYNQQKASLMSLAQ
ncbi:L,D-transpeptidase family protein [Shewanella surugensis]|uniref:L,D-transpeptidase family protein n=1 Tax=Shewanella surugensis TaxID=212020 RepID=A0ABT0LI53_9GAMM|nr:L,D-transpeptidase family protein [Shewanella surugensis]MCL1127384.1 L,D-transpeptidase family protein [Shewanella surugensis]